MKSKSLFPACKTGDLNRDKVLMSEGVNIHAKNNSGVQYASQFGHLEGVKYLVSQGADDNCAVSQFGHLELC